MTNEILLQAKKLHDLGFAIHWLHNKSKRPVESGWTTGPRKEWAELESTYKEGLNVGVRLGQPSKIKNHFLAVIDVDVKSTEERHSQEVQEIIGKLTDGYTLPEVQSGRGNGSRHYYILTDTPLAPQKLHQSNDVVKVSMPSSGKPSKREVEQLTAKEIAQGLRLRPAWEVAVMGEGQQVVLPPSLHPDSGKAYVWAHKGKLQKFDLKLSEMPKEGAKKNVEKAVDFGDFEAVPVELSWLPIPEKIKKQIITGEGVEDRSATLLPVAHALHNAGLSQNEILSVLTDPDLFLAGCAYDHAKTSSRKRAAKWVYNYTLKKVYTERDQGDMFKEPIERPRELTFDELSEEQESFDEAKEWQDELEYTKAGTYRCSLRNVAMILQNAVAPDLFKRDLFSFRDFYAVVPPWEAAVGKLIIDDDLIAIKSWLANNWGFEAPTGIIGEAVTLIAMENSFDPVLDWLNELPAWDGVNRLDTWLEDHFQARGDREYLAQVFRKWIVGMVLRIQKPGAHFPWLPIFEGAQGVGKSSFGRILVGEKYFLDWLPALADKDAAAGLQGMWAVEMGELASLRKNEIEIVKAFVTRTVDKYRPPYGRRMIESPRRCVFFGTTNAKNYLLDDSGNRRFKPVEVGYLDFASLERDREQLFAEAKWLLDVGFESENTIELSDAARVFEKAIQAEKMVKTDTDIMVEILSGFFDEESAKKEEYRFPIYDFKISELFEGAKKAEKVKGVGGGPLHRWALSPRNVQFATNALIRMNCKKRHTRTGNQWEMPKSEGGTLSPPFSRLHQKSE